MPSKKNISVVIPCLNEGAGLNQVLRKIPDIVSEVIVIDGNSSDNSVAIARKYHARVIIQKERGYGLALRTGLNASTCGTIVVLDADMTYPLEAIPGLFKYFMDNKLDFLCACRFPLKHTDSMRVNNFFGNLLLAAFTSLIFNFQVTDICSGMWVLKKETWNLIKNNVRDKKWFFSNEIKIEAIKNRNIAYGEKWIELKKRTGETKVGNVWFIGLKVLLQTLFKRIGGLWTN